MALTSRHLLDLKSCCFMLLQLAVFAHGSGLSACPKVCKCYALRTVDPWVRVDCRRAHLDKLPSLGPKVTVLYCVETRVDRLLRETFINASELVYMSVVNNPIVHIEDGFWSGLQKLTQLDLVNAVLTDGQVALLRDSTSVRILRLSSNLITEITKEHFEGMPFLEDLILDNNRIRRFAFSHDSVKLVNLSGNLMSEVQEDSFSEMRILKRVQGDGVKTTPLLRSLDFTHNLLHHVPQSLLTDAHHQARINVSDNPLECDCRARSFSRRLRDNFLLYGDTGPESGVICAQPDRLSGKRLAEVAEEKMQCVPTQDPAKSQRVGAEGDTVRLECPVNDPTGVMVSWTMPNSVPHIINATHEGMTAFIGGDFIITNMSSDYVGTYHCNVTNLMGWAVLNISLQLTCPAPMSKKIWLISGTADDVNDSIWKNISKEMIVSNSPPTFKPGYMLVANCFCATLSLSLTTKS
ncbi:leucine-rich repeat and fibronectin type III domain-containing protein 1-like protein [Diadema antillarum]|uniref:leucine-rich repeat and fibronectin type III domain-containing protein 1-like protein n=1 Tax=Diadema antillarum TaxID=105358 RepID=UPI003A83D781